MSKNVILIGGMPTAGKSTIAREMSRLLNMPWISTEQIREIMMSVADSKVKRFLTFSDGMSAEEYFNLYSPQQIAQNEYDQSIATWPGIEAIIHNNRTWRDGVIIEGSNILPKFAYEEQKHSKNIRSVFLSDRDMGRIHAAVHKQGVFAEASTYPDEFKTKEIEWLYLYDKIIRSGAAQFNLPVVNVRKNQYDLMKVIEALRY